MFLPFLFCLANSERQQKFTSCSWVFIVTTCFNSLLLTSGLQTLARIVLFLVVSGKLTAEISAEGQRRNKYTCFEGDQALDSRPIQQIINYN